MRSNVRPVERAFQLARLGSAQSVAEIKKILDHEGYNSNEIQGEQNSNAVACAH